jgi:hypothetical protein
MELKREYQLKNVNPLLLPDLMDKYSSKIPAECRIENKGKLLVVQRYLVTTFSQNVSMDSKDDFIDFIKRSSEPPDSINLCLECHRVPGSSIDPYSIKPPFFRFISDKDGVFIGIYRSTPAVALSFMAEMEQILELTPAMPHISPEKMDGKPKLQRTVFIAHSFDEAGRSYAFQLTKFLSLLGFEVATGEGFSPERISSKVKRRLLTQGIAIVVLSDKDDMTWLIQEMTGADFSGKPIIILVEEGVTFKSGILGDIEYIRFSAGIITESFSPILEGLRELGFNFAIPKR